MRPSSAEMSPPLRGSISTTSKPGKCPIGPQTAASAIPGFQLSTTAASGLVYCHFGGRKKAPGSGLGNATKMGTPAWARSDATLRSSAYSVLYSLDGSCLKSLIALVYLKISIDSVNKEEKEFECAMERHTWL